MECTAPYSLLPRTNPTFQAQAAPPPPCPPRRFLCCFLNSLPLDSALRVWDLLFFEGSAVVLFRVALALIEIYDQVGRGARWAAPELGGWV